MSPDLAVLVDMDGLLVDSEPEWYEVERAVFARLGATRAWSVADAEDLLGNALPVSAAVMVERAGAAVPVPTVVEWFVESMAQRLAAGVPWKPGAVELLAALRAEDVPTALVSSSYRRLVDTVLGRVPAGTFHASVAGDEVVRGKPHPDPYLHALRLLGVPAERAVVLEDSPTGARAGEAAGCRVVVVPDRVAPPPAHRWVERATLHEVTPAWLRGLLRGDRGEHVEGGGAPGRHDGGEHADHR